MQIARAALILGLLALGAGPARSGASDYAWPIEPPRLLTSGFGEFRPGHFHGGIDLSTERRVGRSVVAVDDGWVWRVRASGVGYGRSIYLRLADGRTALYGHLSAYNPQIAAWVEAAQESLGRYEVDLYPPAGRLPVRRGAALGRSGESGAGPPHLHFEMREGSEAEIGRNPQRLGFMPPDSTGPVIRRLLIDELGNPEERRFGEGRRRAVAVRAAGPGRYRVADTLRVRGAALLSVETYDPGPSGSRCAPATARLTLDGLPVYTLNFDAFDWARAHEVELYWDRREVEEGHHFVLHLYRPAGARDRRVQPDAQGAGWIGPSAGGSAGARRVEISVEDARGNASRVSAVLELLPDRPAAPRAPLSLAPGTFGSEPIMTPGEAASYRFGPATVHFPRESFFAPARLRLVAGNATAADTVGGVGRPWLVVEAPGVVLDAAFRVALRPPAGAATDRLALYVQAPGRAGWSWVGREADSTGMGGTSRRLGRFELREDRTPPRVVVMSPRPGVRIVARRPEFRATVTDALSGVTWRTIDVTLDGVPQIVVYDPESATVSGRSRRALTAGVHTLRVVARDRAGNRTTRERSFRTAS